MCTVDLNLPFSRLLFVCIGHVSAMPVGVWPTALLWMDDVTVSQMWKDKAVTGALKGCGVRHIRARMISDSQGSQALHSRSTEANRVVSLCTEYSWFFFYHVVKNTDALGQQILTFLGGGWLDPPTQSTSVFDDLRTRLISNI